MDIEILTIGTELLLGFTIDTNGAEIAQAVAAIGGRVVRRTSVGDEPGAIEAGLNEALARTGLVITTGGLGPTRDDISKDVVAQLFEAPLEFQEEIWRRLVQRFERMGRKAPESNRSQAFVPRGATVLNNQWGTAPGLWLEGPRGTAILLPGVPSEMRQLLKHEVIPRLTARASGTVVRSATIRTTGIAESALAQRLGNIEAELAPLSLAYLPSLPGVDLRLTAWNLPPDEADRRLSDGSRRLRELAGEFVYGKGDEDLAALVLDRARSRKLKLAVAESCTGGLVGGRITAIPGSSDVFLGGIIAYEDQVKLRDLAVPAASIATHGAVSEEVARAMAAGVARQFGAELAIAVTGIAGPDGGSETKPVGLVWMATSVDGAVESFHYVFPGTREEVRARASQWVLFQLLKRIR
ncbi:MAG TPA: competence/damage-inducible protein A [Gemmatimonadales bacterium]|nr:competence/damage-inducible protein A [Gemmatimonadales bacterium]